MTPLPWSHSSLEKFVSCPKQFYHIKVVKDVKDSKGEAAIWGDRVHKAFETYLRSGGETPLAEEFKQYQDYLDRLLLGAGKLYVEQQFALDSKLRPCDWDSAWVRGIADVLHVHGHTARALDHKTGKTKPDSRQLVLMALLVFYHFPEVLRCKTGFMWLKTGENTIRTYKREEIPDMWGKFLADLQQYKQAFNTDTWQARQSGLCNGWCPVEKCEHWKQGKRK